MGRSDAFRGGVAHRLFWLTAITAVALLARLDRLDRRELWLDEVCTFYWVRNFFSSPPGAADPWAEAAHVPYFFLLRLWTFFTGETAAGLKSFSVAAGALAVVAVSTVAWRIGGRHAGIIAGLLGAVHPLHVYYSLEARVYAFWTVVMAICLFTLERAARTLRPVWWSSFVAAAALAVMTHYYTLLWLPATFAGLALAANHRRYVKHWLSAHAALAVLLLPAIWWLIVPYLQTGPKSWLRETWSGYPPTLAVPKSFWALLPSGGYPEAYLAPLAVAAETASSVIGGIAGPLLRWLPAAIVAFLLLLYAGWHGTRRVRGPGGDCARPCRSDAARAREITFLLLMTLAFLAAGAACAAATGYGYVVARYDLAAWPAAVILIGLLIDGVARLPSFDRARIISFATTALLVACSVLTLSGLRALPASDETRRRAERIADHVGPEDLAVSVNMYRWFLAYEWDRLDFRPRLISFPTWHDRQLCWQDAEAELADPERIAQDAEIVADRIEAELHRGRAVWLLAHGEPAGARWKVDRRFFAELHERGIRTELVDQWLGLARLRK